MLHLVRRDRHDARRQVGLQLRVDVLDLHRAAAVPVLHLDELEAERLAQRLRRAVVGVRRCLRARSPGSRRPSGTCRGYSLMTVPPRRPRAGPARAVPPRSAVEPERAAPLVLLLVHVLLDRRPGRTSRWCSAPRPWRARACVSIVTGRWRSMRFTISISHACLRSCPVRLKKRCITRPSSILPRCEHLLGEHLVEHHRGRLRRCGP